MGLHACCSGSTSFLNKVVKSVVVGGPKLCLSKACDAFVELADASGYALAVMPLAKGLVPDSDIHSNYTYCQSSKQRVMCCVAFKGSSSCIM